MSRDPHIRLGGQVVRMVDHVPGVQLAGIDTRCERPFVLTTFLFLHAAVLFLVVPTRLQCLHERLVHVRGALNLSLDSFNNEGGFLEIGTLRCFSSLGWHICFGWCILSLVFKKRAALALPCPFTCFRTITALPRFL